MSEGWRIGILCSKSQVNLDILLNCGQSFRWKRKNSNEWIGVIGQHVWQLCQKPSGIEYKVYGQQALKPVQEKKWKKNLTLTGKKIKSINDSISTMTPSVGVEPNDDSSLHLDIKHENNAESQSPTRVLGTKGKIVETICKGGRQMRIRSKQFQKTSKLLSPIGLGKVDYKVKASANVVVSPLPLYNLDSGSVKYEDVNVSSSSEVCGNNNSSDDIIETSVKHELFASGDCEKVLQDYFQMDVDLCELYSFWSSKDLHFQQVSEKFEGIRMLRQDPTENLISFVCSSNNHISRITSMVDKLCLHYGHFIAEVDGEKFYSFPAISALTGDGLDGHLRELGFGYRAKFIAAIARYISEEKTDGWLDSLREEGYHEAKTELMRLMGVGAKVADCVCLMSLDKAEAVPVDTHVWQITIKNYLAGLKGAKSLTDKIYNQIGDFYRSLWGPYAGWAHSVLFTADLRQNKTKKAKETTTGSGRKTTPGAVTTGTTVDAQTPGGVTTGTTGSGSSSSSRGRKKPAPQILEVEVPEGKEEGGRKRKKKGV